MGMKRTDESESRRRNCAAWPIGEMSFLYTNTSDRGIVSALSMGKIIEALNALVHDSRCNRGSKCLSLKCNKEIARVATDTGGHG